MITGLRSRELSRYVYTTVQLQRLRFCKITNLEIALPYVYGVVCTPCMGHGRGANGHGNPLANLDQKSAPL